MIKESETKNNCSLNLVDLKYLRRLYEADHYIFPCRVDGSKAQRWKWERDEYGKTAKDGNGDPVRRSWEVLEHEFSHFESGICLLCGVNGMECLDIENDEYLPELREWIEAKYPGLYEQLVIIETPGLGIHMVYKCSVIEGSHKLALDIIGDTLIETRGRGGYFVAPGSSVRTHDTGRPYKLVQGDLCKLATITSEQRQGIHDWCKQWHMYEHPAQRPTEAKEGGTVDPGDPNLPSNVFARLVSWQAILEPAGWQLSHSTGDVEYWTRPGKDSGVSASTGFEGRGLHIFSSNCAPFEAGKEYKKAGFVCIHKFNGDWEKTVEWMMKKYVMVPDLSPDPIQQICKEAEKCFVPDEDPPPKPRPDLSESLAEQEYRKALEKLKRAYKFEPISMADFDKMEFKIEWLVENMIVYGQPTILGGPKKSLKTNIMCDLLISVGTGCPFLGHFQTNRKRIVMISGESGDKTLQETCRRICASKDLSMADVNGGLALRLPKLSVDEELKELSRGLKDGGYEVCMLDPLYLCLLNGSEGKSASNIYDMGPLLLEASQAVREAGAMPLFAHHARMHLQNPFSPLDLEDLSFSGVQEFARQWLLLNRRSAFVHGSGEHDLWMAAGGSAGHSGLWGVDIKEGILQQDFSGRIWDVRILNHDEAVAAKNAATDARKTEKRVQEDDKFGKEFMQVLQAQDSPPTKTAFRQVLGWGKPKFERIQGMLLSKDHIRMKKGRVASGNGAGNTCDVIIHKWEI